MKTKVVIKLGSLSVTQESGGACPQKITQIVRDLTHLKEFPIIVSSGAINTGKNHLKKLEDKKMTIAYQQACAAVGQPLLMKTYQECFLSLGLKCAQILLTHEDFKNKERFLNMRNTINCLVENNIIPIINENDSISYKEITVGDNDQLAVMMTEAVGAEKLIILSEADGLYDKDPKDKDAIRYEKIDYDHDFRHIKFLGKSSVGRGGMKTKINAIKKLTPMGIDVFLGSYIFDNPILRVLEGNGGTLFKGKSVQKKSKSWPSTLVKTECGIIVDEGCFNALLKTNSSILPVGIKKILGEFKRGDVIQVKYKNKIIALGIVEFNHKQLHLIKGKKTHELPLIINSPPSKVVIHKDNLVLRK